MRNNTPLPALTIWPGSTPPRQHQPSRGGDDVQPAIARLRLGILRLRDADARIGGIASGALAVHVGLGNKAARHQRIGARQFGLRQIGVGLRDADRGGKAGRLLCLHRTIDDRERLSGADPLAGLDQHADDLPAFAGDPDGHFASCRDRAVGRNGRLNRLAARHHHGDAGHRCGACAACRTASARGTVFARTERVPGRRQGEHDQHHCDDQARPFAAAVRLVIIALGRTREAVHRHPLSARSSRYIPPCL